jgi:hypothetical protein
MACLILSSWKKIDGFIFLILQLFGAVKMNPEDPSITPLTPEEEKKFDQSILKHKIALLLIQITDYTRILAELKLAKECPITLENLKRRYGSDYACL